MRVLALQPYDTASHRAFLAGWQRNSRHTFEVLALPGRHFKWRMRQAPIAFAEQIDVLEQQGERFDALWCTSMLDLAALRGLCRAAAALPTAVYFHENQLAYPTRHTDPRDLHFGLTNMTTALAAIASQHLRPSIGAPACVWWNSAFNRDSFLEALKQRLDQMPDERPGDAIEMIRRHSAVHYPGIDLIKSVPRDRQAVPRLLWAARWEHDKGPELFFDALRCLQERGVPFRLNIIGEQFNEQPACFDEARQRYADVIDRWGYRPTRSAYVAALRHSDIVVSTAKHEFFGLAVAEAISAGCLAVLPDALAYPEVWGDHAEYHDQTPAGVADTIERAIAEWQGGADPSFTAERFGWSNAATYFDDAIERLVSMDR